MNTFTVHVVHLQVSCTNNIQYIACIMHVYVSIRLSA